MMQLKCQNCGGQLKFDEDSVKVVGNMVVWRSKETLTCQSCGTQFIRGDDLSEDKGSLGDVIISGNGNIVVGDISNSSGVVIGGGKVVIHGDLVGRDKTTVIVGNDNKVIRR